MNGLHAASIYSASLLAAAWSSTTSGLSRLAVLFLFVAAMAHFRLATSRAQHPWATRVVVTGALLAAGVWLGSAPPWSDDAYRYLLDGRLSREGLNPYAYAPNSPKIAVWVATLPGAVNHPELPTIYPPAAQLLFVINAWIGAKLFSWRLLCCAAVALGAVVANRSARGVGVLAFGTALATHPLVVVSAAGHGHLESFAILALWIALTCLPGRQVRASVAFGWLAGLKLFPLMLLGAVGATRGNVDRWRSVVVCGLVTVALLIASYLPFGGIGLKALGSAQDYATHWEFNATGYHVVRWAIASGLTAAGLAESFVWSWPIGPGVRDVFYHGVRSEAVWVSRDEVAGWVARLVTLVVLGATVLFAWVQRVGTARAAVWILLAYLFFSPVVHPWYLIWLWVPSAMAGSRVGMAWTYGACLAFWAPAAVVDGGVWHDPVWPRLAQLGVVGCAWWIYRKSNEQADV